MINEKDKIIKANFQKKDSKLFEKIEEFYEGFNALFYFILKNPLNNFWWECISLSFQYCHLLVFIINQTVSIQYFFLLINSFGQFGE